MKKSIGLFAAAIILNWGLLACQKNQHNDEKSIKMLKDFYTSYITETSLVPRDLKKIDSILKKYCTDSLLKQWEELSDKMDYDLLIDGQFCEREWLNTMAVLKDKTGENTYSITFDYILNDKRMQSKINLQLVEKNGIVMIDKIILQKKR